MINLRMIEFYRLGIALLMLMFFAGRASAQASIMITESSGTPDDGILECGRGHSATLTASGGETYLWDGGQTDAAITVTPLATTTYTVSVTSGTLTTTISVEIMVTDTRPPIAKCDTITVKLDSEGLVLVDLEDVDDNSFDSCSAAVTLSVPGWFTAGRECSGAV
ncbi:MAG: hypothetical protein ACKOCH_22605, partial [Bacteroidota bacterium]